MQSPFHDQAEKARLGGFTPGCIYINVNSKFKPPIVDINHNPIVDRNRVYAGVWGICSINPYDYGLNPPQPKKGVGFGLQSVMIIGDDKKVGGGGPDSKVSFSGVRGITNPIVRPDVMQGMPSAAPPMAPAAGIPGYTAPGGGVMRPNMAPPAIPQQHYAPPQPQADDDSWMR